MDLESSRNDDDKHAGSEPYVVLYNLSRNDDDKHADSERDDAGETTATSMHLKETAGRQEPSTTTTTTLFYWEQVARIGRARRAVGAEKRRTR